MAETWLENGSILVQVDNGEVAYSGGQIRQDGASRVRARRTTAQSLADATAAIIVWNTEDIDNLGEYNLSTGVFTAQKTGYYLIGANFITASVTWAANNVVQINAYKNGSFYSTLAYHRVEAALTTYMRVGGSDVIYLNAGDTLDFRGYVARGAGTDILADNYQNYMYIHRLS